MFKPYRGPDVPRVVQPRVPRAVGDQQLPRHDDPQPAAARRDQPGARGAGLQLPDAGRGQQRRRAPACRSRSWSRTSITAYEVGYTGIIKQRATVTAAWFQNDTKNDVFFTQVASYRATTRRPAGRCRRSIVLEALYCPPGTTPSPARPCPFGAGNGLPAAFSYRNFGKVRQKGIELGMDGAISKEWSAFANYSYQPDADSDRLRQVGDEPAAEEPVQPRRQLQRAPVSRQPADQLPGQGLLAGRARQPLSRAAPTRSRR